jgi:putative sporulation protein YtxC
MKNTLTYNKLTFHRGPIMKHELQIAMASDYTMFIEELEKRLNWIKQRGYSIEVKIIKDHNINFINITAQGKSNDSIFRDQDIISVLRHQVSEIIAEYIVAKCEPQCVFKEIQRKYKYLSAEERKAVHDKATRFLNKCNNNESLNLLMNFGRKNRIARKIIKYLETNNRLLIDGFIKFCLSDYLNEIRFAVELAVEEYQDEKEYNEFIKLLRYFVDSQTPKVLEVNLMMGDNGVFHLWDKNGHKIEEKYMNYYLEDMVANQINLDDVLISILITIAPRKIILHNVSSDKSSKPVEMIRNVFQGKIENCSGCTRCYPARSEPKSYR